MRTGGQTRAPYVANGLPLPDTSARNNSGSYLRHVQIRSSVRSVMMDLDIVPIVRFVLSLGHDAITNGANRRACGCCEISAGLSCNAS